MEERTQKKWMASLAIEMLSSEESDWIEGNDGSNTKVINTRPLHWRADKVTDFFYKLDDTYKHSASQRSLEMTRPRGKGLPSDRPKPLQLSKCQWLFK